MIREILSQNETQVTVSDHDKITLSDDNKPIEKKSSVNTKRSQGKNVRFSKEIHVRLIDENETIIDYTYPASKPVSYTHLDVYKRQIQVYARAGTRSRSTEAIENGAETKFL